MAEPERRELTDLSSRLRVSFLAAVAGRSDGSQRRPCVPPRALLPGSTREPCPFHGRRGRPCWQSHAASVDPSRQIHDPLLPPYPPATLRRALASTARVQNAG